MEDIPRTPMLTVELKSSIPVDFQGVLKRHIFNQYGEDPDNYNDELAQLNQLRESAVTPARDYSGCRFLRRYFCQLHFLEARFPLQEGGTASLPFSWTDSFSGKSVSVSDVAYEQASILFNLGALHSQLGDYDSRTTDEGMRVSCTHFQCAAGAFDYVKEHFASAAATPDMGGEMMALLTSLMLGQAQECMLEKAMRESKKGNITCRLAWQVANYYSTALMLAESQTIEKIVGKKAKSWQKHFKVKSLFFMSLSQMFASASACDQNKGGERVAYLKLAGAKIAEAMKLAKDEPKMKEPLSAVAETVSQRLNQAIKENDFVYHDRIPDATELPEIQGTSIVKPIPFQPNDPSVSGADIFAKLVPMAAHEASSVYSEEKAKILRQVTGLVEAKNEELSKAMVSFKLEDLTKPYDQEKSLPPELKAVHAEMKDKADGLKKTKECLTELETTTERVKGCLDRIDSLLKEDEDQEQLIQEKFGPRPASTVAGEIRSEWKQYCDAFTKGAQTNGDVLKKFEHNGRFFELLTGTAEGLVAALPSLSLLDMPVDEDVVENLQKLLDKVEQMKLQRAKLLEDFKQKLSKDDITCRIVTHEGEAREDFFTQELEKHQEAVEIIRQNLDAQDRILAALTEANAKYASTRHAMQDVELQREEAIHQMVQAAALFDGLEARAGKGLGFFTQLDEKIAQVVTKCEEFFATRKRERPSLEPVTPTPPAPRGLPTGGVTGPSRANLPPKPSRLLKPPTSSMSSPADISMAGMGGALSSSGPTQPFLPSLDMASHRGPAHSGPAHSGPTHIIDDSRLPWAYGDLSSHFQPTSDVSEFSSLPSRFRSATISSLPERVVVGQSLPSMTSQSSIAATTSMPPFMVGSHFKETVESPRPMKALPMRLSSLDAGERSQAGFDHCDLLKRMVVELEERLRALSQVSPDDGKYGLTKEWEMLSEYEVDNCALFTTNIAQAHARKNRSMDVLPYDHNRIKIRGVAADYINASLLTMGQDHSAYIVSQAPIPDTVEDFWTMVWEYDIPVIAMLTPEIEEGRVACHRYWPEGGGHVLKLGLLSLTLLSRHEENSGFVIRDIRIKNTKTDEEKKVVHLQFTSWPAIGVPQSPKELTDFVVSVEASYRESSPHGTPPLLIQCSLGAGRSGVFLLLHCAIRALQVGTSAANVPEVVQTMRQQRMRLIEDKGQYTFCYRALLHFIRTCLKEAEEAAGDVTPLTPASSKQPMQSREEAVSSDPLSSINAFWKVESGALVSDTTIKEQQTRDNKQVEPTGSEFNPLTANRVTHDVTVSVASEGTQQPQSTLATLRQVPVSYGSGGTVVHVLGSAIPSVLSPQPMVVTGVSNTTMKLEESDSSRSGEMALSPYFQALFAQKQKHMDMQTVQLAEQAREIRQLQQQLKEQQLQAAEQQKLLIQKQMALDEQNRVISDMQQRLGEQKHLEQRLEQLTEMMLLQQKEQLELRMEERQRHQQVQQQLHHQHVAVQQQMEEEKIKHQQRQIEEEKIKHQQRQMEEEKIKRLQRQEQQKQMQQQQPTQQPQIQRPEDLQQRPVQQQQQPRLAVQQQPSVQQQLPQPPVQQQNMSIPQQQPSIQQQQGHQQQQIQQPQLQLRQEVQHKQTLHHQEQQTMQQRQLHQQQQQGVQQRQLQQQQQMQQRIHQEQQQQMQQQQQQQMQQRIHQEQQQMQQRIHQEQQQQQRQMQQQQQLQQQQLAQQLQQQQLAQQQRQIQQLAVQQPTQTFVPPPTPGVQGLLQPQLALASQFPEGASGRPSGQQWQQVSRATTPQSFVPPSLQSTSVPHMGQSVPQSGLSPTHTFHSYRKQEPQQTTGVPLNQPLPHSFVGQDQPPAGSQATYLPVRGQIIGQGSLQQTQQFQQHVGPGVHPSGQGLIQRPQTSSSLGPVHMHLTNVPTGTHPYVQK